MLHNSILYLERNFLIVSSNFLPLILEHFNGKAMTPPANCLLFPGLDRVQGLPGMLDLRLILDQPLQLVLEVLVPDQRLEEPLGLDPRRLAAVVQQGDAGLEDVLRGVVLLVVEDPVGAEPVGDLGQELGDAGAGDDGLVVEAGLDEDGHGLVDGDVLGEGVQAGLSVMADEP